MLKKYVFLLTAAAIFSTMIWHTDIAFSSDAQTEDSDSLVILTEDPIAFTGHGAMFDHDGNQIDVTPDFIRAAQHYYLNFLLEQANAGQRAQLSAKQHHLLDRKHWDDQSEAVANAALIDWLIQEVNPADAGHLSGKNKLLKQLARSASPIAQESVNSSRQMDLSTELQALLIEQGLVGNGPNFTEKGGAEYIAECEAAGVPKPPDWGSNQWIDKGVLTNEFISSGLDAQVYSYSTNQPEGICIALPRAAGNTIELLGIICQGKVSSNACFWDNQENKQGFDIQKGEIVPLSKFAGGADLFGGSGGVCTDCHAGENAYIVHPNTPLALPNLLPDRWHIPLVHPEWPQNPGPTNILENISSTGDCTACHQQGGSGGRFPELSTDLAGYCGAVLSNAIMRTMPTGSPNNQAYQAHSDALLAACNNAPTIATVYVDTDATSSGNGTQMNPFQTVTEGVNAVATGGTLMIVPGFYAETAVTGGNLTFTINKRITLRSTGGSVVIGKGPNNTPQAVNDAYTVQAPQSAIFDVLANDSDPDGDTLTVRSITVPTHGTATVGGTVVRYTPKEGHAGADSFTYTISDGFGGEASASINVTVLAAKQPDLTLSLSSLDLSIEAGNNSTSQTFTISNSGTGTLNWTASESIPWLTLSVASGTAPSTVTVSIDSSGLTEGEYTGEIQITAGDQTETITVSLKVESNTTPVTHQLYLPLITR